MAKQVNVTVAPAIAAQVTAAQAIMARAQTNAASLAAGADEVNKLMGMGAFSPPAPAPVAPAPVARQTKYHAANPGRCAAVHRAEIPSFKNEAGALSGFVITAVGATSKPSGETFERLEVCRKFLGQSVAAYAAAGGDRNWLGYFTDRGKVTINRA